jgi:hypothetical protein
MPRYFFDLKDGCRRGDPRWLDASTDAKSKARIIAREVGAGKPANHPVRSVAVIKDGLEIAKDIGRTVLSTFTYRGRWLDPVRRQGGIKSTWCRFHA